MTNLDPLREIEESCEFAGLSDPEIDVALLEVIADDNYKEWHQSARLVTAKAIVEMKR